MTRFITLFLGLICSFTAVNARTIQGIVLSAVDSTAVAGAECILSSGSETLAGTVSGNGGHFSLETMAKSALTLEISMTGLSSTNIIIESGSKNLNIGVIYLDEGQALNEVTVTGNTVLNVKGRTIVYPSVADVKASSTAISLFQKMPLPGLEANPINRSITVDGGSPVVLINGVPSSVEDVNALQPKDIEKIEFSRFTPARYADSGGSGYISITLKKRDDGGQVFLWGRSALNTAFVDASTAASYHQGPSQFKLQYRPSWRNYQDVYDNTSESFIGNDFRVDMEKHDRNPFNYLTNAIKLNYDFRPSNKTLFSASFTATPGSNKSRSIAVTNDTEHEEYDNLNLSTGKSFTPSLDLFLRQDFNDNNTLEVQVVGTLSSDNYRRDNSYIFSDGSEDSYIMNVDSRRRSLISEACYIHTFSDNTSLSAGYQNAVSHSTNTYLSSDYKPVLTENNNYAYVRLGQSFGRVYIALATGAKLFWIKNDSNKRNFIRNLSSVQLSWNINNRWTLQGSFRFTPQIPSLSALTDYPQQTTPYLISNGNPDLKASNNFLYTASASYSYKKFQASFQSAYFNASKSVISDISYLGDGLFLSQSVNARYRRTFQNDLSLRLSGIYGFGANMNLMLSHYQTAGADWVHKLTAFEGSISLWWNKGPYTISYWRKIPGKYLSGHYVGKSENGDALQFEWQPERHWTVGASWMYMFDKKGTRYPAWDYSTVNPSYRE
ncbi:MAG: hypothetical protein K2N35_02090 [Muribaculaceae bacterium]|nr:hypothetical protein [Muribaculaceae bacterium]